MSANAPSSAGPDRFGLDTALLRTAFDNAPVGVGVCDEDGRFLEVNDSFCALLGRPRGDILGRPFLSVVHPRQRAASMASYFRAVVAAAVTPAASEHDELLCVTGSGEHVWVSANWTITQPDENGNQYGIVHLSNVSSRRRAEHALGAAQRRFELAFRASPIGIAVLDVDGRLRQTNPALRAMLGYSQKQLAELDLLALTHPDDRAAAETALAGLVAGTFERHDTVRRHLRSDGSVIFARRVLAVGENPCESGDPAAAERYVLLQLEDVTGERIARDELRERALRDPLTGLASREALAYELSVSTTPRSLVVTELRDGSAGDRSAGDGSGVGDCGPGSVLVDVARRLMRCSRGSDLVARLGECEFAVLLDDADGDAANLLAQRISAALAAPVRVDGASVALSFGVGSALDGAGVEALETLVQWADAAMHVTTPPQ